MSTAGRPGDAPAGARAEAMARRLERTARRIGVSQRDRSLLLDSYRLAMEPRLERVRDDHHPDYLHPARTALILMDDCGVADVDVLVAALLTETRTPALAVPAAAAESISTAGARIRDQVSAATLAGDRLLESLLALSRDAGLVASAERLDHARHLHLRPPDEWPDYHAVTCAAYAPVAARAHPRLGERLGWWCSIFRRRFLAG